MPSIDVSDALSDPEFTSDNLVCSRRNQTIGSDGIAVNSITTTPFFGVVTNERGDTLDRLSAGDIYGGSIVIHSLFNLQVSDIVTAYNIQYTVKLLSDYSMYGLGFTAAICERLSITG